MTEHRAFFWTPGRLPARIAPVMPSAVQTERVGGWIGKQGRARKLNAV